MSENRRLESALADRDNHVKLAYGALGDMKLSVYLFDHIHKLRSAVQQ